MPRLLVEIDADEKPVQQMLDHEGRGRYLELEGGRAVAFAAQYRRCAKAACSECPHGPYAYAVIGSGNDKKHVYLGALPKGSPLAPTRPKPRRAQRRR